MYKQFLFFYRSSIMLEFVTTLVRVFKLYLQGEKIGKSDIKCIPIKEYAPNKVDDITIPIKDLRLDSEDSDYEVFPIKDQKYRYKNISPVGKYYIIEEMMNNYQNRNILNDFRDQNKCFLDGTPDRVI